MKNRGEPESAQEWAVDLRRRTARHKSGFVIYLDNEAGVWGARRSNAEKWVQADFAARAPLVPALLVSGVAAFQAELRARGRKR